MNFIDSLNKVFGLENRKQTTIDDIENRSHIGGFGALFYGGGSSYVSDKAMLLSAVYRAVEIVSDGVAQLPFEPYINDANGYKTKLTNQPIYNILNKQPNVRMSRHTFLKIMVTSMLLRGNAYAYIKRDTQGNIEQIIYIPSEYVTIVPPTFLDEPVKYSIAGLQGEVEAKDLIHILNYSVDGVQGMSTISFARHTLGLAHDSEQHARSFFAGGANVGGILTVQSSLTSKQKQELKQSWQQAFSPETGTPNGVAVLEGNQSFQPISINPKDSQLIETRQFNVVEIARWFGVSPTKLFDLSKSSYSTLEQSNLSFLTDTLQPILSKFEQEFNRKIFTATNIEAKFDTSKLLRADKAGLASYYNTLFNIGVMSPNEIRKELDLTVIEYGDNHFIQSNLLSVKEAANNRPQNSMLTSKEEEKVI